MAKAESFPILRLPLLGYEKVLQLMDLPEQFKISSLHRNITRVIRRTLTGKPFDMSLFFKDDQIVLKVYDAKMEGSDNLTNTLWSRQYVVHRDRRVDHIKKQIAHFANICEVLPVCIKFRKPHRKMNVDFIPFIKSLNLQLGQIEAFSTDEENALVKTLFAECSNAQALKVHCRTSYDFTLHPETMEQYPLNCFHLSNAPWFSVSHLTTSFMNCQTIRLTNMRISAQEVNVFLRAWVQNSPIQTFLLENCSDFDFNLEEAGHDLPIILVGLVLEVQNELFFSPGFFIHQENGTDAAVYMYKNEFCLRTNYVDGWMM